MRITGVRAQQTELKESLGKSPGYVTREASQEQLGKSNLLKVGDGKHRVYGLNIGMYESTSFIGHTVSFGKKRFILVNVGKWRIQGCILFYQNNLGSKVGLEPKTRGY